MLDRKDWIGHSSWVLAGQSRTGIVVEENIHLLVVICYYWSTNCETTPENAIYRVLCHPVQENEAMTGIEEVMRTVSAWKTMRVMMMKGYRLGKV